MKKNLLKDISASTIQVVLNQVLGLTVFILTSRYLAKSVYGEFNWSLAVLTFFTTILSLRLEQIIVRKVAAGEDAAKMLTLFTGHVVFSGLFFYALLFLASLVFPAFFTAHALLLILAISQLLGFFSSPFKQVVNGREHFRMLAVMSSVSNITRVTGLMAVLVFSTFTIQEVLIMYIVSAALELLVCLLLVQYRLKIALSLRWTLSDYFLLLRESLPQVGVVFLNACIARFDWIILGIFSTTQVTAEYSFAYKVFEICPLPMLILGPVLLSRFSAYFSRHTAASLLEKKTDLGFYMRYAMIAATFIPLVLNIVWTPLVDAVTNGKYGAVNKTNFFLLSLCIPFQYMINLLWTIEFAQNRLKRIFRITAVTCFIIVAGDLFMIPYFDARGAALVYLLATVTEYGIYLGASILVKLRESWQSILLAGCIALMSGFAVEYITYPIPVKLAVAVGIYLILLPATGLLRKNDWQLLKQLAWNK